MEMSKHFYDKKELMNCHKKCAAILEIKTALFFLQGILSCFHDREMEKGARGPLYLVAKR